MMQAIEEAEKEDSGEAQPSEVELDLWEEGRLECYNHLSSWDKMEELTRTEDLKEVWHDTWFMEHMFGQLLRARVKKLMDGDEQQQVLLNFVDAAMTVQERKQVLEVEEYGYDDCRIIVFFLSIF